MCPQERTRADGRRFLCVFGHICARDFLLSPDRLTSIALCKYCPVETIVAKVASNKEGATLAQHLTNEFHACSMIKLRKEHFGSKQTIPRKSMPAAMVGNGTSWAKHSNEISIKSIYDLCVGISTTALSRYSSRTRFHCSALLSMRS